MNNYEALRIFGINSINNINETEIKRIYRDLMKKNHPDIGGSIEIAAKINEAYNIINEMLKNISKSTKKESCPTLIMKLSDLIRIYNGINVTYGNKSGDKIIINKSNINSYNIHINITGKIIANGDVIEIDQYQAKNIENIYNINVKYKAKKYNENVKIQINILDRQTEMETQHASSKIVMDFNGIKLAIKLERQLI